MRIDPASNITCCLAAIVFVIIAAGCSPGGSDKAANDASVASATQSGASQARPGPAVEDEAQEAARLPSNFPEDFPLPDGFTITSGTFTPGDAVTHPNFLVQGTGPSNITEIGKFYEKRLLEAGYKVLPWQPPTPEIKSTLLYFQGNGFKDASVQLRGEDGQTHVLISLPLDE